MKPTDFARLLTSYLSEYLPGHRNVAENTIKSYRDTFKLLLVYCKNEKKLVPEKLSLSSISSDLVYDFLEWLEETRKCSVSTRNQRLAAIHAFFRYIQTQNPESLLQCQRILCVRFKKSGQPSIPYLQTNALKLLLLQPNKETSRGRRDLVLITTLYDTGARVSEIINLTAREVRLDEPAVITLVGKGGKIRHVPLMKKTRELLLQYFNEHGLLCTNRKDHPVFYNSRHEKLTRAGVAYIIEKYTKQAQRLSAEAFPSRISPHVLRHTKAIHLLQANVNLVYIRDLLGHVNVSTTEIYARTDSELRRHALEKAYIDVTPDDIPNWSEDQDLISWLQHICN